MTRPAPPATTVYLALGANLGDREANLRAAVAALSAAGAAGEPALVPGSVRASALYETDAVAEEPQPPYLNAVLRGETRLSPDALLARCLAAEAAAGRRRAPGDRPWAPRLLDVDVLLYGARVIATAALVVPHPRLVERGFVRVPLAEVAAPALVHPVTGARLDDVAAAAALGAAGNVRPWPAAAPLLAATPPRGS